MIAVGGKRVFVGLVVVEVGNDIDPPSPSSAPPSTTGPWSSTKREKIGMAVDRLRLSLRDPSDTSDLFRTILNLPDKGLPDNVVVLPFSAVESTKLFCRRTRTLSFLVSIFFAARALDETRFVSLGGWKRGSLICACNRTDKHTSEKTSPRARSMMIRWVVEARRMRMLDGSLLKSDLKLAEFRLIVGRCNAAKGPVRNCRDGLVVADTGVDSSERSFDPERWAMTVLTSNPRSGMGGRSSNEGCLDKEGRDW